MRLQSHAKLVAARLVPRFERFGCDLFTSGAGTAGLDPLETVDSKLSNGYLAEFNYRFNRRFKLEDMVPRLGYVAVRTPPMPMRLLTIAEVRW